MLATLLALLILARWCHHWSENDFHGVPNALLLLDRPYVNITNRDGDRKTHNIETRTNLFPFLQFVNFKCWCSCQNTFIVIKRCVEKFSSLRVCLYITLESFTYFCISLDWSHSSEMVLKAYFRQSELNKGTRIRINFPMWRGLPNRASLIVRD